MTRNKSNALWAVMSAVVLGLVLGYSAAYKDNLSPEKQQEAIVARYQECAVHIVPVPEEPHG